MTFQFQATEQQIREIAANAVQYSRPVGRGYLGYRSELVIKPEDIDLTDHGCLHLDYVAGRCVKLFIHKLDGDEWLITDEPSGEYQTGVSKYPTNEALVESVTKGDRLQQLDI